MEGIKKKKQINLTYLLGAGASFGYVPTGKEIEVYLDDFIASLLSFPENLYNEHDFPVKDMCLRLKTSLLSLRLDIKKHASFDTYVRKLWLAQDDFAISLTKKDLSIFFAYVQCIRPPSKKHDAFLASILKRNNSYPEWPNEIKVITWNYDVQLELAAMPYFNTDEIDRAQKLIFSYPSKHVTSAEILPNIVHLNGVSGHFETNKRVGDVYRYFGTDYYPDIKDIPIAIKHDVISKIIFAEYEYRRNLGFDPLFTFSWEENTHSINAIESAIQIAKETNYLVVIGYSFPYFNREVDHKILEAMSQVAKIYIQNPDPPDLSLFEERFGINRDRVFHFNDPHAPFYIPNLF
jgi:hypothetical protein